MYKLLSKENRVEVAREYSLRRTVVALSLLALLLLITLLAVAPSLILAMAKVNAARVSERAAEDFKTSTDRETLEEWVAGFNRDLALLAPGTDPGQPYNEFVAVLESVPSKIKITNLYWQRNAGVETLRILGEAEDRQALLSFQNQLKSSGRWSGAEFPVDVLAKDVDINFELTLTPN